jgi:hypothetical protein
MMSASCYSHRLLNPFRGVLNVITLDDAEAETIDGFHWTLYVSDLMDYGQENPDDCLTSNAIDIKYGSWSQQTGFRPGPRLSVWDMEHIESAGARILAAVKKYNHCLPFPLRDQHELWLLDQYTQHPLALLNSACDPGRLPSSISLQWNAGMLCETTFQPRQCRNHSTNYCTTISNLINDTVGNAASAQWFWRDESGNGIGHDGINLRDDLWGRKLNDEAFPPLQLPAIWSDSANTLLINDFLSWQAPWLLLLQHLSDATRFSLEQVACQQASMIATHYALYPKIIDEDIMKAALIESRLRDSVPEDKKTEDTVLTVDYIEL